MGGLRNSGEQGRTPGIRIIGKRDHIHYKKEFGKQRVFE